MVKMTLDEWISSKNLIVLEAHIQTHVEVLADLDKDDVEGLVRMIMITVRDQLSERIK